MTKGKTPKELLTIFKKELLRTAKFYGIPAYKVGPEQFDFVAKGVINAKRLRFLGTFATLRQFVAPSPEDDGVNAEAIACLKRIVEATKNA